MESFKLEKDVNIIYVTADSFPAGISAAIEKIRSLTKETGNRNFYSISKPNEKGVIIYKAGVEEKYDGEGMDLACDSYMIKKGNYASIYIKDYPRQIELIGQSFQELISRQDLDPETYCIEMYIGIADVRCMVRLQDQK